MDQNGSNLIRGLVRPKRRWAQFSLTTLFVGVTVCCLGLAWRVEQARRQRDAVLELHRFHVAVIYRMPGSAGSARDSGFTRRLLGAAYREPVDYVGFSSAHDLFHDPAALKRALALLPNLRELRRLNLEGLPVTDDDLDSFKSLTGLTRLDLRYTGVTETGVAELRRSLPRCEIIQR